MKIRILLTAIVLGIGGTAAAATIGNLSGQSCGASTGTWHFVNNQTGGAGPGILAAEWSSGSSCVVGPSAVNQNVQHFYCTAAGTLQSAVTNLPGKLVLSDFTCGIEPPKCDPKYDKDCKY